MVRCWGLPMYHFSNRAREKPGKGKRGRRTRCFSLVELHRATDFLLAEGRRAADFLSPLLLSSSSVPCPARKRTISFSSARRPARHLLTRSSRPLYLPQSQPQHLLLQLPSRCQILDITILMVLPAAAQVAYCPCFLLYT
ncbi:hypothetical protein EJB05_27734, partial [Eragrostis curvula]